VDPPSESVRAATTPSLQPYEPSAWVTPSAPPTSPETPRDLLLAPIIAVAEQLSKLVLTDDDGVKEKGEIPKEEIPEGDIPKGDIPEEEKPKSTGAIPKGNPGGAKGRSKRPPSIATSDEEYVPAGLNGNQPPLKHGTVAERLAATGTHPRAALISGPPEIVVGEAGYSPPSTPPSLGHWQGLEVGGAKDPRGYYYPLKRTTQEEDLQLALALAADAESGKSQRRRAGFIASAQGPRRWYRYQTIGRKSRSTGPTRWKRSYPSSRRVRTSSWKATSLPTAADESSVPQGREGGLRASLPLAATRSLWLGERQVHHPRDLRSDPAV
jgi:hypothetical protein